MKVGGTGVIISSSIKGSRIVTAEHVVREGRKNLFMDCAREKVEIYLYQRSKPIVVKVLKENRKADVALMWTRLNLGVSTPLAETISLGSTTHSYGWPVVLAAVGKKFEVYSKGVVSTIGIQYRGYDYICYTSKIFFGNSGGGLFNNSGELVALTTVMYKKHIAFFYGPSAHTIRKVIGK
jgi:S1-C subfamily serine protease